jgi:inositol oxygenase
MNGGPYTINNCFFSLLFVGHSSHGLGRIVSLLDDNQDNELQSFDWTLSKSSMIVGCSPPPSAKFVEYYPRLNADYLSCNTKLGIYTEHCGLRNVLLSWSASEYLYCWLRFHRNNIPEEGLAMIRFLHLKDWYSRHKQNYYQQLTDETDEDMKPFVSEFERLIYHAKKTFTTEVSDEECTRLWEQFYHPICNKYDFDDTQLQW